MKEKRYFILAILIILTAVLLAVFSSKSEAADDNTPETARERITEIILALNLSDNKDEVESQLHFIDKSAELTGGQRTLHSFMIGDYVVYYDARNSFVNRIMSQRNHEPSLVLSIDETILQCDKAFEAVMKKSIESSDSIIKNLMYSDESDAFVGVGYYCVVENVKIPAASIYYDREGKLADAVFFYSNDVGGLRNRESNITEEAAIESAEKEIRRFLAEHFPDKKLVVPTKDSLEYKGLQYLIGEEKVCMEIEYESFSEDFGFEIYFQIYVDASTGDIIANNNNLY
ncbi:MAG: hypothetical protein J5865_07735 [Lachnospiraceae bacterium]|nr:hypothetical protein [Lachnospiraceae bacterium]